VGAEPERVHGLIDTGALLALLDRDDDWHPACVEAFRALRLPLATTPAVLTELFHLLGDDRRSQAAAWGFLLSGALRVRPIAEADLPELRALMEKYADRPMDFADASLVLLGRRESLATVFTVDHDDFETYRVSGKRRFRVVPGRAAGRG